MGSDDGSSDEKPVHLVKLDGYLIGKYEVTNKQYLAFCTATGHEKPSAASWGMADNLPVVNVSWKDAKAFCDWAGLALPTEAQWEYAARGKDGRKYPWGNEAPDADGTYRANWGEGSDHEVWKRDGYEYTAPVGCFAQGASRFGALDMAGNVWEWCADWYDEKYYAGCGDGMRNPLGPEVGSSRVVRGGSWNNSDTYLRGAYRGGDVPGGRNLYYGFRVARSPAR